MFPRSQGRRTIEESRWNRVCSSENIVFLIVAPATFPPPPVVSVPFARSSSAMLGQYPDLPLASHALGRFARPVGKMVPRMGWNRTACSLLSYPRARDTSTARISFFFFFFVRINLDGMAKGGSRTFRKVNGESGKAREIYDCPILLCSCKYRGDVSEKVLPAISMFMISQSE